MLQLIQYRKTGLQVSNSNPNLTKPSEINIVMI